MKATVTYEAEIRPGEGLRLPEEFMRQFEPGFWIVSVRPKDSLSEEHFRDHSAFLSSYSDEDEGLYDDDAETG